MLVRFPVLLVYAAAFAGPAAAQDFKVVTTFTVLADMARNVAGDAAEVVSVTKPGAEIHGYEPTPQDLVAATDADLILILDAGRIVEFGERVTLAADPTSRYCRLLSADTAGEGVLA